MKSLLFILCVFFLPRFAFSDEIINLGKITTVISNNFSQNHFSSEAIQSSSATTLTEFLAEKNCLALNTGGIGSQASISIRGYAGFCIKVYVDGILANDPNTGEFDWNSLSLDSIESITIHDTPLIGQEQFSGSTISITTKAYSDQKISFAWETLSYASNPFDTQHITFTLQDVFAQTPFKLSLSSTQADNRFLDFSNAITENNKYESYNGFLNWNKYFSTHSIGGSHQVSFGNLQVPASQNYNLLKNFSTNQSLFGTLFFTSGITKFSLNYNCDSLRFSEQNNSLNATDNLFHLAGIQIDHSFPPLTCKTLQLEPVLSLKASYTYANFLLTNSQKYSPTRLSLYPSFSFLLKKGYVKFETLVGYLFLTDTIFHNHNSHHSVNAAFTLSYKKWLSFSATTQNAQPTFNQLYWNYAQLVSNDLTISEHGNPDLKAEKGYSLRLRLRNEFLKTNTEQARIFSYIPLEFSFGFSYYENKIRWISDYYKDHETISLFPSNMSSAFYFDGTLASKKQFLIGKHAYFGYDIQCSITKTFLLDEKYYGNQIMWVPLFLSCSSIKIGYKKAEIKVGYDFTSKRYVSNYNETYYAPIHLLSCQLSFIQSDKLRFIFTGKNLLDWRYVYHDTYSAPSRSFSIKIKATL
ncbi:MAG: hypothetical protein E7062_03255 [Spirochaetaceae bacterium]|nr:hypothetical protein [Spirochaetaceae bacterium]